jgi:hypothetical protein
MIRERIAWISLCGIIIAACINFQNAWAITVSGPKLINLLASQQQKTTTIYGSTEPTSIFNFKPMHAQSYFMIGMAPELITPDYYTTASYNGYFLETKCALGNSAFPWQQRDYLTRLQKYQQRTNQMSSCMHAVVNDFSPRGLSIPAQQPNCKIMRLNETTAIASGGYCFFGISPQSSFSVSFELNSQCANSEFMRSNSFVSSDIFNHIGFYIAGDTTGSSLDLEMLGNTRVRTTFEPSGKLLPISANFSDGEPQWPTLVSTDIHWASLRVLLPAVGSTQGTVLDSSLFISNICQATCNNGVCESPCDFTTAIGAEMQLHELRPNGTRQFLGFWYAGGAAAAQWEGTIPSSYLLQYGSLKIGKRYRISANLSYPHLYFNLLGSKFQQQLIDLSGFSADSFSSGRTLPTLSSMNTPRKTTGSLPTMGSTPTLTADSNLQAPFEGPLTTLKNMIQTVDWPPYYEFLCGTNTACQRIGSAAAQIKLSVEFDLVGVDTNGVGILKNLTLAREAGALTGYRHEQATLSGLHCGL